MLEPSERTKIAIVSLSKDPDFQEFTIWLKAEKERCELQSPMLQEDFRCRWNQGNLQTLNALIETIENIEAIINPKKNIKNKLKK